MLNPMQIRCRIINNDSMYLFKCFCKDYRLNILRPAFLMNCQVSPKKIASESFFVFMKRPIV